MNKITCYILPIDWLLIALDAHMISHNGYGPGDHKLLGRGLGARSFWTPGLGPGPISITAEHMCITANQ